MKGTDDTRIVQNKMGERLRAARGKTKRPALVQLLRENPKAPVVSKAEMTAERLKQWEYGNNPISHEWIPAICDVLDCDVGYLFGEYKEKKREISDVCRTTGLNDDAVYFMAALNEENNFTYASVLRAINALLSEERFDECFKYWERLSVFLFNSDAPFKALLWNGERNFTAEDVLSILLSENEQFLRALRREVMKNG